MKPSDEEFLAGMDAEEREFHEQLIREELMHVVNNEIALYQQTGDARFFWKAIIELHEHREPIPESYMAQIVRWANSILRLSEPREIATALELTGDGKRKVGPSHSDAFEKRWRLASEVQIVKRLRPSLSLDAALKIVARNRSETFAKVKGAYHSVFTAPVAKQSKKAKQAAKTDLSDAIRAWR